MILNQDWMFVNLSLLGHDDMMLCSFTVHLAIRSELHWVPGL